MEARQQAAARDTTSGEYHALQRDVALHRYDHDFAVWVAEQVTALRLHDFGGLDIGHIIEELEGLSGRDRSALRSRLTTLMEHIIKEREGLHQDSARGWRITIRRNAREIAELLSASPSLKTYLPDFYARAFRDAREDVMEEYDVQIPDERLPQYIEVADTEIQHAR